MKIVAITDNEWEDLKEIRLSSLKDSPEAFGLKYEEAVNYTSKDWKNIASDHENLKFFIAYENDLAVGLIGGVFSNSECELVSMWVSPNFRGLDIGGKLIRILKEYALKHGYSSIVLKVSQENKSAYYLYKKCGFTITGKEGLNLQAMVWSGGV